METEIVTLTEQLIDNFEENMSGDIIKEYLQFL